MKPPRPATFFALAPMFFGCVGSEPDVSSGMLPSTAASAPPAVSFESQVATYIRRFPYQLTYDYTLRYTGGDPAKLNTWAVGVKPALVSAGKDIVPHANHDTYYRAAALLLADGPVVLESSAPTPERFNSFQLTDDRNANYRNIVYPKGKYTLYFGAKPDRIEGEAIEAPSNLSFVIARVEVRNEHDPGDVAAAQTVIEGMTIRGPRPREFPRLDLLSEYSPEVAAEANRRMDETFAMVPFTQTVVGPGQEPGRDVPYLYHSAGTKGGWGGPDPSHSVYETILLDDNDDELNGSRGTYSVTTEEPPVNAFWSVTVYDTDRGSLLHPNPHDRYHINDASAVRNDDGTVTFTFRRLCEAADINCLDIPAGRFDVVARYYLPQREIITGAWTLPKLMLTTARQ